ncbi:hypothetical protein ScPMuIL_000613 [Solemya velum]
MFYASYNQLPESILKNEKLRLKRNSSDDFLTTFLEKALPAHRVSSIDILQYRCQPLSVSAPKKYSREGAKRKKTLTSKEKRKLKLFDLKSEQHKFAAYEPLHNLWKDYIRDLVNLKSLNENNFQNAQKQMIKADFHGCYLSVVKSKCPSNIGKCGIVLQETKNIFKIIMKDNKIKCIPKVNSIFVFEIDGFIFRIYGNHFCFKASMRSVKKFKLKATMDL